MDLKEIERENVGWIYLPQYKDQWQALENMVISLKIS
jgi:hypothetical protein